MRHVEKALLKMPENLQQFISIENAEDVKGVAPIVKFTIQSDPVSEVGVNGLQVTDILRYSLELFNSLNENFSCVENKLTMWHILRALDVQKMRTQNRILRGVEGKNEL